MNMTKRDRNDVGVNSLTSSTISVFMFSSAIRSWARVWKVVSLRVWCLLGASLCGPLPGPRIVTVRTPGGGGG